MKTYFDIAYGEHPKQRLDLHLPERDSFPLFIYFHGGGLEAGDKSRQAFLGEHLAQRGIAFANVNYRMYPEAEYPDFIEDAAAAVKWCWDHIGEYGHCQKIAMGGSSAGAYLTMMLCFDKSYLAAHDLKPEDFAGYFHDAGQPTTHFRVLKARGIDSRRVIVDEAAPLYHIGKDSSYPPMTFIVSDDDMENRYEQTMLTLSTLKHFGADEASMQLKVMHGKHVAYVFRRDENGNSVFAQMIAEFMDNLP